MKKQYGHSHRTVGQAFLSTLIAVAALLFTPLHARAAGECVAGVSVGNTFELLAGQTIPAGTVSVSVNGSNLEVTFATTGGWELSEAHLWIGNAIADLPQTKTGNPIPGKFPYNSGALGGATSHTFSIPLSNPIVNFSCPSLNDAIYYMAAHASVRKLNSDGITYQNETGWSKGTPITSKGSWATMSTFTLSCICPKTGKAVCETAFAKHATKSTCFNDIGFERWGWTNGPLGLGNYSMDVWAGAGQCDLAKGTHVGTLSVNYSGSTAIATFNMFPGFWMEESHLYIGSARLPVFKQGKNFVETVAPGQYPQIHDDLEFETSDTFSVNGLSGNIYVVGHAVVCHEE